MEGDVMLIDLKGWLEDVVRDGVRAELGPVIDRVSEPVRAHLREVVANVVHGATMGVRCRVQSVINDAIQVVAYNLVKDAWPDKKL